MTRTEQQEMAELGMYEETLEDRRQALAAKGAIPAQNAAQDAPAAGTAPNGRKKRADAGKPRPKPPAPVAGVLTKEQVARIDKLRVGMEEAHDEERKITEAVLEAEAAYFKYLDELTAK